MALVKLPKAEIIPPADPEFDELVARAIRFARAFFVAFAVALEEIDAESTSTRGSIGGAQLVEHSGSGKKRILVQIVKDEYMDVSIVLTAPQAEELAKNLSSMAREARGKNIVLPGGGLA